FSYQAEAGIRVKLVTGVQTCALPISGDVRRADNAIVRRPLDLRAAPAVDDRETQERIQLQQVMRVSGSGFPLLREEPGEHREIEIGRASCRESEATAVRAG